MTTLSAIADLSIGQVLSMKGLGVGSLATLRAGVDRLLSTPQERVLAETQAGPWRSDKPHRARRPEGVASLRASLGFRQDLWETLDPWMGRIFADDPIFGLRRAPHAPMADLLDRPVAGMGWFGDPQDLRTGLVDLAARVRSPVPLLDELRALAHSDRQGRIFIRRVGWDGLGENTLEAVGLEFDLTRERIRQIVKRVKVKRLAKAPFAPTLEIIVDIIQDNGGAITLDDLGGLAEARGLVRSHREITVMLSVAALGIGRRPLFVDGSRRVIAVNEAALGERVAALTPPTDALLPTIRSAVRRRGLVRFDDIRTEEGEPVEPDAFARVLQGQDDLSVISDDHIWRPSDMDSTLHKRVKKLLVVRGPQPLHVINRSLRRDARKRSGFGPRVSSEALRSVLDASPVVSLRDGAYGWIGADRNVHIGVAEGAALDLLLRRGPAMHSTVIQAELVRDGIDPVTLWVALSTSLLLDRVAPAVYTAAGESALPSDIEYARSRATRTEAANTSPVGWVDGEFRIDVEVVDLRRWNGFLRVPADGDLDGEWTLASGEHEWVVVVSRGQLRNGVKPWLRRQQWHGQRVSLRFNHAKRTVTASLS